MKRFIIFFARKNGLRDFLIIYASNFKDAVLISKSISKATKYEILGVCRDCFKSFKLDNNE